MAVLPAPIDDHAAAAPGCVRGFVIGDESEGVDDAGEAFAGDAERFHAAEAEAEEDGVVFGGDPLAGARCRSCSPQRISTPRDRMNSTSRRDSGMRSLYSATP